MNGVALVLRVVLATVFIVAAVGKLRDRAAAGATVGAVGVPPRFRPPVAFALCVAELGVAGLLLLPGLGVAGAVGAAALLTVFLVALTVQYLRGVEVPCACFGQITVTPAGAPTLARNALLLAGAVLVILGG